MGISFTVNQEKVLEAIVYIASKKPGIDIYHTVKTMFYADKLHLNRYARPVLGDIYIKMENGPVPSFVRDVITFSSFLPEGFRQKAEQAFSTSGKIKKITVKRSPELKEFSETDIECLNEALDLCKDKTFEELKELTHKETAWIKASMSGALDYSLLVDVDNPYLDDIICDLVENGKFMVI